MLFVRHYRHWKYKFCLDVTSSNISSWELAKGCCWFLENKPNNNESMTTHVELHRGRFSRLQKHVLFLTMSVLWMIHSVRVGSSQWVSWLASQNHQSQLLAYESDSLIHVRISPSSSRVNMLIFWRYVALCLQQA